MENAGILIGIIRIVRGCREKISPSVSVETSFYFCRRHLGYEVYDFFRCRNLLLEITHITLHIGALDKQRYLFLSKAGYTTRDRKANIGEPRDCYI